MGRYDSSGTAEMRYQELDPEKLIETVQTLSRRVKERFPDAGLNGVCGTLLDVARQARERAALFHRPILWIRVLSGTVVVLLLVLMAGVIWSTTQADDWTLSTAELIQVAEAALNEVVALGVVIFFMVSLETRLKRRRALEAIHELRVLSHIIDMHQLTKDPDRILSGGPNTTSSPKRTMTAFQLNRYLDYCSEMLSLIGKIAVLYVQGFPDEKAISAVNEVENLTSGLSRKIWQKIMILHSGGEAAPPTRTTETVAT